MGMACESISFPSGYCGFGKGSVSLVRLGVEVAALCDIAGWNLVVGWMPRLAFRMGFSFNTRGNSRMFMLTYFYGPPCIGI